MSEPVAGPSRPYLVVGSRSGWVRINSRPLGFPTCALTFPFKPNHHNYAETAEALAAGERRIAMGERGESDVCLEMMERGGRKEEEGAEAGGDDARMLLEEGRQQEQQRHLVSGRRGGGEPGPARDEGYCKWCDMAKASTHV